MRLALLCIAAVFALGGWLASPVGVEEPVHLDSGLVSGTTTPGGAVRVFRGIPYAAPPVGKLRWSNAVAQLDVPVRPRPAQVEIAVAQPRFFGGVDFVFNGKRRRFRVV